MRRAGPEVRRRQTSASRVAALAFALVAAFALAACDRNVEPFDPDEQPSQPDLARIFPEAESAGGPGGASAAPAMPPAPGGATRGNAATGAAGAQGAGAPIRGRVEVAEAARGAAPARATLFVIARRAGAAGGPPLAVLRLPDPTFPLDFEIGPENAMIAGMPFAGDIALTARLDADGDAMTRGPSDLTGALASPVQPGATGVRIELGAAAP